MWSAGLHALFYAYVCYEELGLPFIHLYREAALSVVIDEFDPLLLITGKMAAARTASQRLFRALRSPLETSTYAPRIQTPWLTRTTSRCHPINRNNLARRRQYATSTTTPSKAIVASTPGPNHRGAENWNMTNIQVPTQLKDGEILVEMVATGICHTDIALTNPGMGQSFPIVPGHEGWSTLYSPPRIIQLTISRIRLRQSHRTQCQETPQNRRPSPPLLRQLRNLSVL